LRAAVRRPRGSRLVARALRPLCGKGVVFPRSMAFIDVEHAVANAMLIPDMAIVWHLQPQLRSMRKQ